MADPPTLGSRRPRARDAQRGFVETSGFFAPFAVIAYCLALAALRLSFAASLEADEAEFVGRADFRLIYDNAHPPLFNWATRVLLTFTGWSWPDALAILKFGLLAGFHFLTWHTATKLAGPRAGALALAASAFLPQIVWMSVFTLAHSVMVLTGAAALLYCALRALRRPGWKGYVWLGLAISLGALAKFNFFLLLVPFFLALAMEPQTRRLFTGPFAWLTPMTFLATSGPTFVAAALFPEDSGARIGKLYQDNRLSFLDLPYVGVDGFISLLIITVAWIGPAAVIWLAARYWDKRATGAWAAPSATVAVGGQLSPSVLGRVLERTMLGGLALFALLILAFDVTKVEERYLTPVLALSPIYLALRWPLGASAGAVVRLAMLAYLAVIPAYWAAVTFGNHRYAIPYEAVAAQIRLQSPEPAPIYATRHDDVANVVLALGWPGARSPRYVPLEGRAILLWRGRAATAPARLAPPGFGPASPIATVAAPYTNRSGREAVYSFQLFERTAAGFSPEPPR